MGNSIPDLNGGVQGGVQVWYEQLNLNVPGQQLEIAGAAGTFTLTYTNPTTLVQATTGALNINSPTLAGDIINALNALPNMAAGLPVSAIQFNKTITLIFGGTLVGQQIPMVVATPTSGDAIVEVSGTNAPLVALPNVDDMWRGPVTLLGTTAIDVPANSRLTLDGAVGNQPTPATPPAALTKLDLGELALGGANTYRGTTYVDQGILTAANNQALGGVGVPDVQTVTTSGASGVFTLNFDGYTTPTSGVGSLPLNASAAQVQAALNALPSIGGVGGSVAVAQISPGVFSVTFSGGSLAGADQPQIAAAIASGIGTASAVTTTHGYGGTLVANGAQLQLQEGVNISGECIQLQGTGPSTANDLPLQWFSTGDVADQRRADRRERCVRRSGDRRRHRSQRCERHLSHVGRRRRLENHQRRSDLDAAVRRPLRHRNGHRQPRRHDRNVHPDVQRPGHEPPAVQRHRRPGAGRPGRPHEHQHPRAGEVGSVTVTQVQNVYTVTFSGGSLADSAQSVMTASGIGMANPVVVLTANGAGAELAEYSGAIAVAPEDPNIIYLGTGESDNSGDSYYGTGVYVSTNAGQTWSLLTSPGNNDPLLGTAVSRIVVDTVNPNIIYVSTSDLPVNGPLGNAGVWRYDGTTWLNLTNITSLAREFGSVVYNAPMGFPDQGMPATPPPGTPGPDDDWTVTFPNTFAAYSDLSLVQVGSVDELYFAIGTPFGDPANGVYRLATPDLVNNTNNLPQFYEGDGNPFNGTNTIYSQGGMNTFPVGANDGNIKISAILPGGAGGGGLLGNVIVLASVATPNFGAGASLQNVYISEPMFPMAGPLPPGAG